MRKPTRKTSRRDEIEARAAAWLAQRDEGFSAAQAAEFEDWRRESPRHAEAIARLERAWLSLEQLGTLSADKRDALAREFLREENEGFLPGLRSHWAALSTAVAAVLVFAIVILWPRQDRAELVPPQIVRNEATDDVCRRLTLDDGSIVDMNAHTELRVAYAPGERRVQLVQGEASFSVAKNKERPFLVSAGGVTVRAVGTAFNVRMAPAAVEVLVTEGRVKIEKENKDQARHAEAPLIGAGEKIVIASVPEKRLQAPIVTKISQEAIRQELGWQPSWLRFDETPLAKAIDSFNRQNRVQLELSDPRLGELKVDGNFRVENVEAFVRLLEMNGGIVADRSSAERIVLRPGAVPVTP